MTGKPFVWTAAPCQTDKTDRYQGKFTFCCNIKATVEKSEIQPVFLPYSSHHSFLPMLPTMMCCLETFSAKLTESFVTIHPLLKYLPAITLSTSAPTVSFSYFFCNLNRKCYVTLLPCQGKELYKNTNPTLSPKNPFVFLAYHKKKDQREKKNMP